MAGWKFHITTFGCKVNQYESEALREAWLRQGGVECETPADADVCCVNSCAITAMGERDARNAVFRLRREAPRARIVLTGCAAKLFEQFTPRKQAEYARPDRIIHQQDKTALLANPLELAEIEPASPTAYPTFSIAAYRRSRPVVKVQDGCAHRCTYCIVPLTRGAPRSRKREDILAEIGRLAGEGHAEIMLSGINLNQYGRDCGGDFWDLLAWLDASLAPRYMGRLRLRISSLEPSQLNARGIDVLLGAKMLCPHLHISLQHASARVLKRMGRGHYTAQMLEDAVAAISRHWPRMGLGCDLIAGFPGEDEQDVQCLLELIGRLPFSYAHVFPYSARPGTAAARFDGQIAKQLKLERARRIREAVAVRQQAYWQGLLALPVLQMVADRPENSADKLVHGVEECYAPCLLEVGHGEDVSGIIAVRPVRVTKRGIVVRRADGGTLKA